MDVNYENFYDYNNHIHITMKSFLKAWYNGILEVMLVGRITITSKDDGADGVI